MEATVGVYQNHDEAVKAVEKLKNAGYPIKQLSIIGQAELVDGHLHLKSGMELMDEPLVKTGNTGLALGAILGPTLGLLAGAGVFMIPGLGFLYGAGAAVGALAGLDIGIISGGLFNVLTLLGVKKDTGPQYEKLLKEGKFLVVAHGANKEIKDAEKVLADHGKHLELHTHTD